MFLSKKIHMPKRDSLVNDSIGKSLRVFVPRKKGKSAVRERECACVRASVGETKREREREREREKRRVGA